MRFPNEIMAHVISFLKHPDPDPHNCADTIPVLKDLLRSKKLKVGGRKLDLIKRLLNAGCPAKRPYWDTKANAGYWGLLKPSPRVLLTFDTNVHTKEDWEQHTREATNRLQLDARTLFKAQKGTVPPLAIEKFEYKVLAQVGYSHRIASMHSRYLNEMDKARQTSIKRVIETQTSSSESESSEDESGDPFWDEAYHPQELFIVFGEMRVLLSTVHRIRKFHGIDPSPRGLLTY